jgi:hypothetical protein
METATKTKQAGAGGGPEQGVIEEARRRRRARRLRAAGIATGVLALLGGGAWAASGGDSHGRGARESSARQALAARRRRPAAAGTEAHLVPALAGGEVGWCVVERGGGGCDTIPRADTPLFGEGSSFDSRDPYEVEQTLAAPWVRAVLVDGRRRVPALREPWLPYGIRLVRVLTPAARDPRPRHGGEYLQPHHEPVLQALDARGAPLPNARPAPPVASAAIRAWQRPQAPVHSGPCDLRAHGLPGLTAQWGHVVSAIEPYPARLIGRTFVSCVDTEYYLRGWPLDAALLLDAAHPGRRPAAIPGLRPLRGARGVFGGPDSFHGALTAKRVGDAWLVVAGGASAAQRLRVLGHLTPRLAGGTR